MYLTLMGVWLLRVRAQSAFSVLCPPGHAAEAHNAWRACCSAPDKPAG